jgi:hypothetical protein
VTQKKLGEWWQSTRKFKLSKRHAHINFCSKGSKEFYNKCTYPISMQDSYHAWVENIWQRPTLGYLWEHDFKCFKVWGNLMHSPTKKKSTIIIFFTPWGIISKYCSILVNNIEKMRSMAIYHPFQVLISIPLVQILKNTSKPCLATSQKLGKKIILSGASILSILKKAYNQLTWYLIQ